jgi:hypothetical protein
MFVGFPRFEFVEETPLMPFRVLRPIPAMAVERIFEFFENVRSRFLGAWGNHGASGAFARNWSEKYAVRILFPI